MGEKEKKVQRLADLAQLPRKSPLKVWGGRGTGERCAYCGEVVGPSHISYEVDAGEATATFHASCFTKWRTEAEEHG